MTASRPPCPIPAPTSPGARARCWARCCFSASRPSPRSCRRFCRRRACSSWPRGSATRETAAFFLRVIACVLPAVAFMIVQYMYYFGIIVPSQGDMVLELSLDKLGRVLLSTLLIQAFPLYVLVFFRKDGPRDTLFNLSLIMDAVGCGRIPAAGRERPPRGGRQLRLGHDGRGADAVGGDGRRGFFAAGRGPREADGRVSAPPRGRPYAAGLAPALRRCTTWSTSL